MGFDRIFVSSARGLVEASGIGGAAARTARLAQTADARIRRVGRTHTGTDTIGTDTIGAPAGIADAQTDTAKIASVARVQHGNVAEVTIAGRCNGATGASVAGNALSVGLPVGTVLRDGLAPMATPAITGAGKACASASAGDGNTIMGTIDGPANAVAVSQTGDRTVVSFDQFGAGTIAGVVE